MRKLIGYILAIAGSWMLISPQSLTGLKYLKWMHNYAFPGEVLVGIVVLAAAYFCLDLKVVEKKSPPLPRVNAKA